MWKKFISRIKNPKIATSVVSGLLMILVNTGIISVHMSNSILAGFNTILGILVGFGIFSNPDSHVDVQPTAEVTPEETPAQPTVVPVAPSNQPIASTEVQPTQETK